MATGASDAYVLTDAELSLDEMLASFMFQGFNAATTVAEMKKLMASLPGEKVLQKCLAFYLMRGTNTGGKGNSPAASEFVLALTQKFKIQKRPTTPQTLTLARIASAFAATTCAIIAKNHTKVRIVARQKAIDINLPLYYAWPGAPAVIPKADKAMFNKWLEWATEFDKIIHSADGKSDQARVKQFAEVAWSSDFFDDSVRNRLQLDCVRWIQS